MEGQDKGPLLALAVGGSDSGWSSGELFSCARELEERKRSRMDRRVFSRQWEMLWADKETPAHVEDMARASVRLKNTRRQSVTWLYEAVNG